MAAILVTGFDGFEGHVRNPSWEMIKDLPASYGGVDVVKLQVPTMFREAPAVIVAKAKEIDAQAIVSFGLDGSDTQIRVETRGHNYGMNYADNSGFVPAGLLDTSGTATTAAYPSLPADRVVSWITPTGVPARISTDSREYVCNSVVYGVARELPGTWFTFMHVMAAAEDTQYGTYYKKRPLADLVRVAAAAVEGAAIDCAHATRVPGWPQAAGLDPDRVTLSSNGEAPTDSTGSIYWA